MPIGSYTAIPHVAADLVRCRPRSVLDLGVGFGMYGAVVREWVDFGVRPWTTRLVGVEAWGSYRSPLWDLYDVMYVETIQEHLQRDGSTFDCIILGDVLEHFELSEGDTLLSHLKTRLNPQGRLFAITPAYFHPQDAVYGNEFERHRSLWTADDLARRGFEVLLSGHEPQPGFPTVVARYARTPTNDV